MKLNKLIDACQAFGVILHNKRGASDVDYISSNAIGNVIETFHLIGLDVEFSQNRGNVPIKVYVILDGMVKYQASSYTINHAIAMTINEFLKDHQASEHVASGPVDPEPEPEIKPEVTESDMQSALWCKLDTLKNHMKSKIQEPIGKRELFAMAAMQGMIQNQWGLNDNKEAYTQDRRIELCVTTAIKAADALIKSLVASGPGEVKDASKDEPICKLTHYPFERCKSLWKVATTNEEIQCDRIGGHVGNHHSFELWRWHDDGKQA